MVTRHVWEEYMEICEDIRYTLGNKEIYEKRKETIERIFGTAKERHGMRYTNMVGKARMEMKVGLTYLCMNLKKLAKMKERYGLLRSLKKHLSMLFPELFIGKKIPGLETVFQTRFVFDLRNRG